MGKIGVCAVAGFAFVAASAAVAQGQSYQFDYTGSVVTWTVPATGVYRIAAVGGNGGGNVPWLSDWTYVVSGGSGARISGDVLLTANEQISILVGGAGASGDFSGAGGGGSFVTRNNQPLVVAGGGGGGAGMGGNGESGRVETSGGSVTQYPGGTAGNGGLCDPRVSGAGGGFFGAGRVDLDWGALNTSCGSSFISGGLGGTSVSGGNYSGPTNGGYGGGGGAQNWVSFAPSNRLLVQAVFNNSGGGGGGYSGGAGGHLNFATADHYNAGYFGEYGVIGMGGGGGGSFLLDTADNPIKTAGFNTRQDGNGYITIDFIVPAPSAASPLALAGLLVSRRRRRPSSQRGTAL